MSDEKKSSWPTPPGGVPGAWINVVVCAAITVAAAVSVLFGGATGADQLIAVGVVVIGIGLEVFFIRSLRRQLRDRRR